MSNVCPIPGCNHRFERGIVGWHTHVMLPERHPYWHTEVTDATERQRVFQREFPDFFMYPGRPTTRPPKNRYSSGPPDESPTHVPTGDTDAGLPTPKISTSEAARTDALAIEDSLDRIERHLIRMLALLKLRH